MSQTLGDLLKPKLNQVEYSSKYEEVLRALRNLLELKDKKTAVLAEKIKNIFPSFEAAITELSEAGFGKQAKSLSAIERKLISVQRRLESKDLTSVKEYKALIKDIVAAYEAKAPSKEDKASINVDFKTLNLKNVKIDIKPGKMLSLDKAPMLVLTKAPLTRLQEKLLLAQKATRYEGANVIVFPSISVLSLNLEMVDKRVIQQATKQVLASLFKGNEIPVAFHDYAVTKSKFYAVPVVKQEQVKIFASLFDNAARAVQLLVE
jgi:uncharacterized protein YaaR (DUF327 family)